MRIKALAESLIERCGGSNDPFAIADLLGIRVVFEKLGKKDAFFTNMCNIPIIHINEEIAPEIRDFVCAHELGHALLHRDTNASWLAFHTYSNDCRLEREANQFAVELLMPDEFVKEFDGFTIYDVGTMVGIPRQLCELKSIQQERSANHVQES